MLLLGWAVLAGAGVVRSRREAVRAAGLALILGWAVTGLSVSFELMLGLRATLVEVVAGLALVATAALATARVVGRMQRPRLAPREWPLLASVSAAGLGLYLLSQLAPALVPRGVGNIDVWAQWLLKAKVIYFLGLDTGVGGYTSQQNGSYPPLDPALESTAWHFAGSPDLLVLPFLHWIVFAAFFGAVAYVLAPRVRALFLWPSLAMLALVPRLAYFVGSSLGDEPVALLLGLAAVLAALWLLEQEPRWLVLACIPLAAATLTKNEGLVMSLILALLVATAARRRLGLALVAAPFAAEVPWKLWQHVHHVRPTFSYDWARLLHPGQLAARTDYLTYGGRSLLDELLGPSHWLLIVPIALVLGVLAALRRSPLALVALGFPVLTFIGFELTYWVGADVCTWFPEQPCDGTWHDIVWLVGPSANRIPLSIVVVMGVLFPLLLHEIEALVPRLDVRARTSLPADPASA